MQMSRFKKKSIEKQLPIEERGTTAYADGVLSRSRLDPLKEVNS